MNEKLLELHEKAIKAYIEMLQIHITTKTVDTTFHKATEDFYTTLFNVLHKIGERYVDLGGKIKKDSLETLEKRANEIIVNLKKEVEAYNDNEKPSLGLADLLGTLADDLEDIEGTSKSFL